LVLVKTSKEIPLTTGTQEENLLTPRLAPHVHDATAHKPFFGQETKSVTQKKKENEDTRKLILGPKMPYIWIEIGGAKVPNLARSLVFFFFPLGDPGVFVGGIASCLLTILRSS
jgi:hypothetical protein